MKKLTLLLGIGALTLASCSNDDLVVNPAVDESASPAIGFSVSTGNMTRAATELSAEHWDFGVWGYKGTTAPVTDPEIMTNYLVGYYDVTNSRGYKPVDQQLLGSNTGEYAWYYEGLGNQQNSPWTDSEGTTHDASFNFVAGGTAHTKATSANQYQYLKYWDRAAGTNNWFYACAPYNAEVLFDNDTHKLTFPAISSVNGDNAMYAATKKATPTGSNSFVNLEFNRLLAQIQVAFYEEVPGYKVELIPYDGTGTIVIPAADPWSSYGANAMFAVPCDDSYASDEYVTSAKPVVTFGGADLTTATTIEYTEQAKTSANINIPIKFFDPSGNATTVLGTTQPNAIKNICKNVLPQPAASTCGFTLNLSLKFTALDTDEVILVKGVRVHVPAAHCLWQPNYRYTYYFKITKNVPGSPEDPGTPGTNPGSPYLWPIVFDSVKVSEIQVDATDREYSVNPVP